LPETVVLGTQNRDKLRELQSLLRGSGVRVRSLADFPGAPHVEETGKTFEANARLKAAAFSKHAHALALADDSGLMVHALNGKPGVYSARFAGPGCTYDDNNRKVLRLLEHKKSRRAKFVSVIAIYDDGRFVKAVKGECFGRIAAAPRGKNGFGYDPIFIPGGFSKTFAELSKTVKNSISHRGRALRKAKKVILARLKKEKR
jgi:XTP/dITP diphosphohydrolase